MKNKLVASALMLSVMFFFPLKAQAQTEAQAGQPQTQQAPISAVNAKYVNGVAPGYWPTPGTGLTLNLSAGSTFCSGSMVQYAQGTLSLTANAINYVFLDAAANCAPAAKTTAFTSQDAPIAVVTTSATAITTISDSRTMFSVGNASPAGNVNDLQMNAGTSLGAAAAASATDGNGGLGLVIGDKTQAQFAGVAPSTLTIAGAHYDELYHVITSAPLDQRLQRWITRPDGSFQIEYLNDDGTDSESPIQAGRSGSHVTTENLPGNLRFGGGNGGTNCDIFSNNPSSSHPSFGLGTCLPATIYGVPQPNTSAAQVFDPQGGDAYVSAHSFGIGRPHFHLWGENLGPFPGATGAYDETISPTGDLMVDSVAGPSIHHTVILCRNFYATDGTSLQCGFPSGYLGPFNQTATNPYTSGNNWAGSHITSNWHTSPEVALGLGTGTPNYSAGLFSAYGEGGYNDYNPGFNFFKSNWSLINGSATFQGSGQHQILPLAQNCWGVGDCIGGELTLNHIGGGQDSASEGVHNFRVQALESPLTSVGTCSTGCTTGSTLIGLTNVQAPTQLGEGHFWADLTAEVVSAGYLTPSQGQDPNTGLQINAITGASFPVSQLFQVASDIPGAVDGSGNPVSPAPGLVTFAIKTSGVPFGYNTSTSGMPASGLLCSWDRTGAGKRLQPYTVVDSTHLSANLSVALHAGSMVATNGMCGYGIDSFADQVTPEGGNMPLHPVAAVFASISPTQVLLHPETHLGSAGGHAQFVSLENIRNFVRTNGVASFDLTGFRPDQFNGLTVEVVGNDGNVSGVTYTLAMTNAGAFSGGSSHFTAPDSRPDYTAPANTQASVSFNNAQFGIVPIAEALKVSDTSNLVISSNVMPLAAGHQLILTHTEVVASGGLDQDNINTFSPQPDSPGRLKGCVEGESDGSLYSWQHHCFVATNNTRDGLYLGHGGTHPIPSAQIVTEGRFTAGADFSLENFGTAITIRPPGSDSSADGSWTAVRAFDFAASNLVANTVTFYPNPNQSLYSTLDFGNMHTAFGSIYAPIYNVGTDAAPIVTITAAAGMGSYTTAGTYANQPVCSGGGTTLGPPVNFNGLGQTWTQANGKWTLTITAGIKPSADTQVPFSCVEPGQTYLN